MNIYSITAPPRFIQFYLAYSAVWTAAAAQRVNRTAGAADLAHAALAAIARTVTASHVGIPFTVPG